MGRKEHRDEAGRGGELRAPDAGCFPAVNEKPLRVSMLTAQEL